jgi:uncharacterized protein YggE
MKSKSFFVVVGLMVLPVVSVAQNRTPYAPYIDVKGHAERSVEPDRFSIEMTVEAVDMKPALARTRVEKHMGDVLAGFKAHHALPESINASAISIAPAHKSTRDDEDRFVGTAVTRTARATFASMNELRQFIDGIDAGEELQITATSVTRSDMEAIRSELRTEAMADSKRNASTIAKAYGNKVGSLYTVSDQANSRASGFFDSGSLDGVTVSASRLPAIDLQVGSIKVERDIYATFLLDDSK